MESQPLEDAELDERANRGDVDAYRLLLRRYQNLAARVGNLITVQPAEAEDAAQEATAIGLLRAGPPATRRVLSAVVAA